MKSIPAFALFLFGITAAFADEPVVKLPKFTVVGERPLPEMEHWRYTKVPGYEILAQCDDNKINKLVHTLKRLEVTTSHIWAPAAKLTTQDTIIIVCKSESMFNSFVSKKIDKEVGKVNVDRLFFNAKGENIIVLCLQGQATAEKFRTDILRDYVRRGMENFPVKPPEWLHEGLCQILSNINTYRLRNGQVALTVGLLAHGEEANPNALEHKLGSESAKIVQGSVDPNGNKPMGANTFKTYFIDKDLPELKRVFAADPDMDATDWRKACGLFTHFCLFANHGAYQKKLEKFLNLYSENPNADYDSLFKKAFGSSISGIEAGLRGYVESADYMALEYTIDGKEFAIEPDIRDATNAEIGRIKGDAYMLANIPEKAGEELLNAYRRESEQDKKHQDPLLLGSLGLYEIEADDIAHAKSHLQVAAAAKVPEAKIYAGLCRLYLGEAKADQLTASQTAACLEPLFTARSICQSSSEIYELIAEVWMHSSVRPSRDNLAVLDEGVRNFPADIELTLNAAQLNAKFGYTDAAQALAIHGQQIARSNEEKAHFAALVSK